MIQATETVLKGCFLLEPLIHKDERGHFFESHNHRDFCKAIGREVTFVQDNQSQSKRGVLRGLHFQKGAHAQAKLISVIEGRIQDVVVDLRKDSPTFKQHLSLILDSETKHQLFIPRGFAHGFLTLSESAIVSYKCDNYYNRGAEGGIRFDDGELGIEWEMSPDEVLVSEKDMSISNFNDLGH